MCLAQLEVECWLTWTPGQSWVQPNMGGAGRKQDRENELSEFSDKVRKWDSFRTTDRGWWGSMIRHTGGADIVDELVGVLSSKHRSFHQVWTAYELMLQSWQIHMDGTTRPSWMTSFWKHGQLPTSNTSWTPACWTTLVWPTRKSKSTSRPTWTSICTRWTRSAWTGLTCCPQAFWTKHRWSPGTCHTRWHGWGLACCGKMQT